MQTRLQQWGPLLAVLGVILIAAAFVLDLFFHTQPRGALLLAGGIGVMFVALFLITRPREELRDAVTGRSTLYGGNSLLMAGLFVGIVVAINFIAPQFHFRQDITANKQHTLSEQTVNILKGLKDPVQVIGFFIQPQSFQQQSDADALLKEYSLETPNLTYSFIDPNANPAAAAKYEIAQDATIVFVHGDQTDKVYQSDENTFTNAILQVTQAQAPVIYFTTGHGELDPNDSTQGGLSTVASNLKQLNYKIQTLNLNTITSTQTISGGLPADTSAVVAADPQKPFSPAEETRLKTYLQNGGRLFLMVTAQSDPGLKDLLASWGITITNDLVLDPALNYGNPAVPGVNTFPVHDVTKNLNRYGGVFFPGARSLTVAPNSDKNPTALFTTTDQACGKTDLQALQNQQQIQCDPAKDEKGPFVLGYAEESTPATPNAKPSRLLVLGNANFAINQIFSQNSNVGNLVLFVNSINWLAGQEQLIAIPAKDPGTHPLNATSSQDVAFIELSNLGLIPLIVLIIGGVIWWRRR